MPGVRLLSTSGAGQKVLGVKEPYRFAVLTVPTQPLPFRRLPQGTPKTIHVPSASRRDLGHFSGCRGQRGEGGQNRADFRRNLGHFSGCRGRARSARPGAGSAAATLAILQVAAGRHYLFRRPAGKSAAALAIFQVAAAHLSTPPPSLGAAATCAILQVAADRCRPVPPPSPSTRRNLGHFSGCRGGAR